MALLTVGDTVLASPTSGVQILPPAALVLVVISSLAFFYCEGTVIVV